MVAIYLSGMASCLFERNSLDGLDGLDGLYTLNPETSPPRGTPITLTIHAREDVVEPVGRIPLDVFLAERRDAASTPADASRNGPASEDG